MRGGGSEGCGYLYWITKRGRGALMGGIESWGNWSLDNEGGGVLRRGALRVGDVHTCSEETLILATNIIQYIIQYLAGIREGIYPIRP